MNPFPELGKFLVFFGLAIAVAGLLLIALPKLPWIGHLPGDIVIRRENFTFYLPVGTSILASIVLTILFHIFRR